MVLRYTAVVGGILIATFLPTMIFSLFAGVIVDRFSRVAMMLLSDILRGIIVSIVALLAINGLLEIWHMYICSILFGVVGAFFQPAYRVIVPEILPLEDLPSGNSLTSLTSELTRVIGPVVGAWVIGNGGTSTAFAVNATSFFLSAILLLPLLKLDSPKPSTDKQASLWTDLREGIHMVISLPWLWITIGLGVVANATLNAPLAVALPSLIKVQLHMEVDALAALQSSMAGGSILSAIWLGRFNKIRHRGWTAYLLWITTGVMTLALGLSVSFLVLGVVMFTIGASLTAYSLVWTNILQELIPRERRGRVYSIDMLGNMAFLPLGYGLAGMLTDTIGIQAVFILGGGLTALMGIFGLLHPSVRQLD